MQSQRLSIRLRWLHLSALAALLILFIGFAIHYFISPPPAQGLSTGLVNGGGNGGAELSLISTSAAGTISLTTLGVPYTQDFNTLANSGTSGTVPTGWDFTESGTSAN